MMDSIAYSMLRNEEISLVRFSPAILGFRRCLKCLKPTGILFEMDTPHLDSIRALLSENPELQLAGLDLDHGRLIVFTCPQHLTPPMRLILEYFQSYLSQPAETPSHERGKTADDD